MGETSLSNAAVCLTSILYGAASATADALYGLSDAASKRANITDEAQSSPLLTM